MCYTNSKYTNSSAFHFYSILLDHDRSYEKLIDPAVYSMSQSMRIIGAAKKINDPRKLIPISSKTFKPMQKVDRLNYLITYFSKEPTELKTPIIEQGVRNKT